MVPPSLEQRPYWITSQCPSFTPGECHQELLEDNSLYYAVLQVTQRPNWVKPPSSYQPLPLVPCVAFEDQGGSFAHSLLSARYLYDFGCRIKVRKWKTRTPTKPSRHPPFNSDFPPQQRMTPYLLLWWHMLGMTPHTDTSGARPATTKRRTDVGMSPGNKLIQSSVNKKRRT